MASTNSGPGGSRLQARFFTTQKKYSVADTPFSVPANIVVSDLSDLINKLLIQDKTDQEYKEVGFDFLINGEFLRVSLGEHLEEKGVSTETVVDIEYVERFPSPQPVGSVLHDDWISSVKGCQDRILTGCYDNHVRLWKQDGSVIATLEYHTEPVKSIAWIKKDGDRNVFASGSHDQNPSYLGMEGRFTNSEVSVLLQRTFKEC